MAFKDEMLDTSQSEKNITEVSSPQKFSDPLWTVEDVADFLKLQPETIRSMARRGELPALKIGKVFNIKVEEIFFLDK